MLVAGSQRFRLQIDKQEREVHRQLGKNVVKCDGEREVYPVHIQYLSHESTRGHTAAGPWVATSRSPGNCSEVSGSRVRWPRDSEGLLPVHLPRARRARLWLGQPF